jgi:alpha-ketoglutarate-dependent taurine dioxygenase
MEKTLNVTKLHQSLSYRLVPIPRSVFSIVDCASNHNDEPYSNPAETFLQTPSPLSYLLDGAKALRRFKVNDP